MGPLLQDQLTESRRCRADQSRIPANAIDSPISVAAMTGRHVVGDGRVFAVATGAQMRGNPLALGKNLDGTAGKAHLDFGASEVMRNAVKMACDIDMVVDTDTTHAPFGEDIGFGRQVLESRAVELVKELPARGTEPAELPFVVEAPQQLADGRV